LNNNPRPCVSRAEKEEKMNIYINGADGSICEHMGLADHLALADHLERMGYTVFPAQKIPSGDYGDGEKMCCRSDDEEYDDEEYDVAVAE
jgi:hypothetical protein